MLGPHRCDEWLDAWSPKDIQCQRRVQNGTAHTSYPKSSLSDTHYVKCYRSYGPLRTPKDKEEPPRLLFRSIHEFFQALDPSVKRYAQTKRLLTGSALAALKLLRNFTRGGLFTSE